MIEMIKRIRWKLWKKWKNDVMATTFRLLTLAPGLPASLLEQLLLLPPSLPANSPLINCLQHFWQYFDTLKSDDKRVVSKKGIILVEPPGPTPTFGDPLLKLTLSLFKVFYLDFEGVKNKNLLDWMKMPSHHYSLFFLQNVFDKDIVLHLPSNLNLVNSTWIWIWIWWEGGGGGDNKFIFLTVAENI